MVDNKLSWPISNPPPSHIIIDGQPVPLIVTGPDTPHTRDSPEGPDQQPTPSRWEEMMARRAPLARTAIYRLRVKEKGKSISASSTPDWHQIWIEGLRSKDKFNSCPGTHGENTEQHHEETPWVPSFNRVSSYRILATELGKELEESDKREGKQPETDECVLGEVEQVEDDWVLMPGGGGMGIAQDGERREIMRGLPEGCTMLDSC